MQHAALIPAAGQGTRLGLGPKCLLRIGNRTVLEQLVATVLPLVDEVLVAAPAGFERELAALLPIGIKIVPGGRTRQESIDRMMQACASSVVLIQDAARPFASAALCRAVLDAAARHGAAGAFLDPTVPVGLLADGVVASYQPREKAGIFQAPQAYTREVLLSAREITAGREFQSTAQMVMDAGYPLRAIPGEPENIKITTELDWLIAQHVIAAQLGLDK